MLKTDYYLYQCWTSGEIAFALSTRAKYGIEAKAEFLSRWIKEYIRKQPDKSARKHIKYLFNAHKTPAKVIRYWECIADNMKVYKKTLEECRQKNDIERLTLVEKALTDIGLNKNEYNKEDENTFWITIKESSKKDGVIEKLGDALVRISLNKDPNKMDLAISDIQNHGFTLQIKTTYNRTRVFEIESAVKNQYIRKIDGTPVKISESASA